MTERAPVVILSSALASVSEMILTSTTREVQAVDAMLDDGSPPATLTAPGPVAQRLARGFADLLARDTDP